MFWDDVEGKAPTKFKCNGMQEYAVLLKAVRLFRKPALDSQAQPPT